MASREKQDGDRKKNTKQGLDPDEMRERRAEGIATLRKKKQEQALMKRRNRRLGDEDEAAGSQTFGSAVSDVFRGDARQGLTNLDEYVRMVNSDDFEAQREGTVRLRRLLSIEDNPPIEEVISRGVVPRLVQFLHSNNGHLQLEAAWALTNIASGTASQTRVVVEAGAVPVFVKLLSHEDDKVRDQAVWALGNIAGDGALLRDHVLSFNAMTYLLEIFLDTSKRGLIRNAIWTLSNFCRSSPAPPFAVLRPALPHLQEMLQSEDDNEILADCCWALSYLSDGTNEKITAVINSGVCPRLIELLGIDDVKVQTPALRCVGNIVTGDDQQTQHMLSLGALVPLARLLRHEKKSVRKEACWTISNFTAGTPKQIQAIIDAELMEEIVAMMKVGNSIDLRKEACWAVSNATSGGTAEQIHYLVQIGAIKPLVDMLQLTEARIIIVALEGIENILESGAEIDRMHNPYVDLVADAGAIDLLDHLQAHQLDDIYKKAMNILLEYFDAEEDDTNVSTNVEGGFAF